MVGNISKNTEYNVDLNDQIKGNEITYSSCSGKKYKFPEDLVWRIGPEAAPCEAAEMTRAKNKTESDGIEIMDLIRLFNK